ncbi:thrombospondin type 3 repeat-containing protein [Haloglomus litoreum]|uniref:thrombospondin type 3 repeat-containing protein n=1 Tax=Haloglomus litoreum TaxID=3034026 RepID=UPI0023E77801|nr:thrombospondin type 3 repeat-containing protein [Haloglomus sp. DT116]
MRRLPAVVLACCILLATGGAPAAATVSNASDVATGGAAATGNAAAASRPADGTVRHIIRLADPGSVEVELGVGVTEPTTEFRVTLPADAEVTATDGFDRVDTSTYEWDGRTDGPTVTYRAPVNRTVGDSIRFAATDGWALVDMTDLDVAFSWRSLGPTSYDRRFAVPDGYGGRSMAYLGEYRLANASAAGQQFTVVHPTVVSTNASAAAYAETLAGVADDIRVGARDPTVTAFIAPPPIGADGGEGGVGGLATSADMWVAADAATMAGPDGTRVSEPIFVHEYVHTRQNYSLAADMAWFTESSAFYYMTVTPHQRGTITERRFDRRFRVADRSRDATLTGTTAAQYRAWATKGPRTLAALDRRIRTATNGSRSLQDVFRRVNEHEGNVTYAEFRSMVAATAVEPQDEWLDRHVDGPALAPRPDPDAYPGPGVTVDPGAAEWRRGDEWVSLSETPLPAGIPLEVRHPEAGVVVRPADATAAVNVTGGDPATVRLPAGEAGLRVETFYGRQPTVLTVTTSEDVDGDGVTNAAELEQGSDPYDASSSTATPEPGPLDGGGDGDGAGTDEGPALGDGPGFGLTTALAAGAALLTWLVGRSRWRD